MGPKWLPLVVLPILSACETGSLPNPRSIPEVVMAERRGNESARLVRYEELDPEEARRMRAMVARAEEAITAAEADRADANPVRYAISAGALPGNSVAALVRGENTRIVVLAPDGDDRVLALADAALDRLALVEGPHLVLISRDGSVTGMGSPQIARLDLNIPVSTRQFLTRPMYDRALARPAVEIAGIGAVHFVD